MLREAVILAGGFGTRLSHVLGNVPKPMAPVYGKPFICYILDKLIEHGITHVVLATGHLHEQIESYFANGYRGLTITISNETTPLFTGGAILQAAQYITGDHFIAINGDTLFDADLTQLSRFHLDHNADLSIVLRRVEDTSRYGSVVVGKDNTIVAFREKQQSQGAGLINGGIYAISKSWLLSLNMPKQFSFEKEILERDKGHSTRNKGQSTMYGVTSDGYFIDIGIPDDYYRACREFADLFPKDEFLFLDRDGVLNRHIVGDYVRDWSMWQWMPGVLETLPELSKRFKRIFIVSNQQGVAKGLMTQADLDAIHTNMLRDIEAAGGHIDHVYTCTDLQDSGSLNRKPAIGMALQAKRDFPEVDFTRSIMIGDSVSDMLFARNAQMRAVYLTKNNPIPDEVRDITDLIAEGIPSLRF